MVWLFREDALMARKKAWTKKRQAGFLEELVNHGNVSEAARVIGMSRQYAYEFRDGRPAREGHVKALPHPEFAELWDDAEKEFLDKIDAEIVRRAVPGIKRLKQKTKVEIAADGTEKTVEIIREATTYHSDRLLEFIAKNRHPNYQAPQKREISGPDGKPIQIEDRSGWDLSQLSYAELKTLRALQTKAKETPQPDATE